MRVKLLALLLFTVFVAFNSKKEGDAFRMPAEWEPHEAVWVGVFYGDGRNRVTATLIKSLYKYVPVKLSYDEENRKHQYNIFLHSQQVDTTKLQWVKDSVAFNWVRDPGPVFLVNSKGEQKVADFGWNDYGDPIIYKRNATRWDSVIGRTDRRLAKVLGLPVVSTPVVAEGGSLETNGAGVLMSIEETALQRNPGRSLQEIEKEYLRVTGCKKMIWLKRMTLHDKNVSGLLTENWKSAGANGHIDEVARFVGPNTILLAKIDVADKKRNPISKIDDGILEECFETLKKATDVNGKPFKIIRMPYPDLNVHSMSFIMDAEIRQNFEGAVVKLKDGDTLNFAPAVSYMNFMVTNGVVLIPKYWQQGVPLAEKAKDDKVKQIFQQLYPDRKIIQINPYYINIAGGGIHCATLQQPRRKKAV